MSKKGEKKMSSKNNKEKNVLNEKYCGDCN